jgi:hypothetical protein
MPLPLLLLSLLSHRNSLLLSLLSHRNSLQCRGKAATVGPPSPLSDIGGL